MITPIHSIKILDKSHYESEDIIQIAKNLLGKVLVTNINGQISSGIIIETEAYRGPDDRGCHAYNNRKTERTKIMFENGGVAYVYLCYGMHPMFNAVTAAEGSPHAILVRAIEPLEGIDFMLHRRNMHNIHPTLVNGPAKLAVALGIVKDMNGIDITNGNSAIYIEDRGFHYLPEEIHEGPRVGMSIHVGPCAHRPWRFYIKNNKWVSKPLQVDYTKMFADHLEKSKLK